MSALRKPFKRSIVLVEFKYGEPVSPLYIRLCSASRDVTVDGVTYTAEPAMDVSLSEQTGGVDEKNFSITLPMSRGVNPAIDSWCQEIASPIPFSPIYVKVSEILTPMDPADQKRLFLAEGVVAITRRNPNGSSNLVELEATPTKSGLENIKLGIQANPQCVWTYGQEGCGKEIFQFFDPSTYYPNQWAVARRGWVELQMLYTGIRTQQVSLRLNPAIHNSTSEPVRTITNQPKGWWLGGSLVYGGLSIPIRDWLWDDNLNVGTDQFVLGRMPPKSWAYDPLRNNLIMLVPGCSKTPEACALRNNSANFGGLGYGMPAYNPMLDQDNR